MTFLVANWWWLSPLGIPAILGALKVAAKLTPWAWDNKIVTLLKGIWDVTRGKTPKNWTGSPTAEVLKKLLKSKRETTRYCRGGEEL